MNPALSVRYMWKKDYFINQSWGPSLGSEMCFLFLYEQTNLIERYLQDTLKQLSGMKDIEKKN